MGSAGGGATTAEHLYLCCRKVLSLFFEKRIRVCQEISSPINIPVFQMGTSHSDFPVSEKSNCQLARVIILTVSILSEHAVSHSDSCYLCMIVKLFHCFHVLEQRHQVALNSETLHDLKKKTHSFGKFCSESVWSNRRSVFDVFKGGNKVV